MKPLSLQKKRENKFIKALLFTCLNDKQKKTTTQEIQEVRHFFWSVSLVLVEQYKWHRYWKHVLWIIEIYKHKWQEIP